MDKLTIKSAKEIDLMKKGGEKVKKIKTLLIKEIEVGAKAAEIDKLAEDLIIKAGGKPSFKMVPHYFWTTCINVNDGVVHGIPSEKLVFKDGDLVSVDLGMFYEGFHLDTSFSLEVSKKPKFSSFLKAGENALEAAINKARIGNYVYDISEAIETMLRSKNLMPIRALVGHGVGKNLHEDPQIPLFALGVREKTPRLVAGMTLAIEIMYSTGSGDLVLGSDGWTISTRDGKIAGLYEETVAVIEKGPIVLT
jgi:methionyl aminopeptidase